MPLACRLNLSEQSLKHVSVFEYSSSRNLDLTFSFLNAHPHLLQQLGLLQNQQLRKLQCHLTGASMPVGPLQLDVLQYFSLPPFPRAGPVLLLPT